MIAPLELLAAGRRGELAVFVAGTIGGEPAGLTVTIPCDDRAMRFVAAADPKVRVTFHKGLIEGARILATRRGIDLD